VLAFAAALLPIGPIASARADVVPSLDPAPGAIGPALVLAQPSLGLGTVTSGAMSDLVVHVEWPHADDVTVAITNAYVSNAKPAVETHVHMDKSLTVVLPVDPTQLYGGDFAVVVRDHRGEELGRARVNAGSRDTPVVVAMLGDAETALVTELGQARIDHRAPYGGMEVKSVTISHPPIVEGRTRPPEHVYGYQEATLVLASDKEISALTPAARAALVSWVKLGGRLALVDTHTAALADIPHKAGPSSLGAGRVLTLSPNEPHASFLQLSEEVRAALESPRTGVLASSGRGYELDSMRRALDPNEHFRPALGAAALLLVIYAIVVGPVLYRRARRRQKPLEVLVTIPVASVVAFGLILGIGLLSKGIHGRSRRLTFVELGNGEEAGPSRIYRAFYSTHSTTVDIEPATPFSLPRLAIASSNSRGDHGETLLLTGDKSVLRNVTLPPWQSVLTSDEAATSFGGGITVSDELVRNDTPRALRDAFVHATDGRCVYFADIAPHTSVSVQKGAFAGRSCESGAFYAWELGQAVPQDRRESFVMAWTAVSEQANEALFQKYRATLVAEVTGMPEPTTDSGLKVESSRTLVRVVDGGAR
jgi:hypothetical protein